MLILGIETSCDETSAAVVRDGREVLSCVISSSKNDFNALGGVIPEDAARKQLDSILPVIELSLKQAKISHEDVDSIAVTYGPGLLGSLLVGTSTARVLAKIWDKPLLAVHHTLGHLSSTWLISPPPLTPPPSGEGNTQQNSNPLPLSGERLGMGAETPVFPVLTLSVSGGHTDLWYRTSHTTGTLAGSTRDDAAGEAYDKGAVLLGLPYPGGPALAALAEKGDETAFQFPHPLKHDKIPDFSFSGLKTSLKYLLRDMGPKADDARTRADIAASFQNAINAHLMSRIEMALALYPETKELHLVGGVSANTHLRTRAAACGKHAGVTVRWPEKLTYCTDNAAMIASAAFYDRQEKDAPQAAFQTHATSSLQTLLQPVR